MDQEGQDELFDIKLTTSGKFYIRKFALITRVIIGVGIFISLIHIASTIFRHHYLKQFDLSNNPLLRFEFEFLPYYTIFHCLLFYPQMYFYWQATKYIKKGLTFNDESTFNKAFRSLYRYALFGIASLLLSSLSYGFELYGYIKDY